MLSFLVDEDLPRSLTQRLRLAGFTAEDVREVGLRGHKDDEVLRYAVAHGLTLLTADLDFANIVRVQLGSHHGIVVLRVPNEWSVHRLNDAVLAAIRDLPEVLSGSLVIVEAARIRLRRPP